MILELTPCDPPKGKNVQSQSQCYFLGDTGYLFCIPSSCEVFVDETTKVLQVLAKEVNLPPPNVKQRVTNKFYAACKKSHTKINPLLVMKSILS